MMHKQPPFLTLMRIIMRIPIPKAKGLREGGLINQGSTPRVGSGVRRCWGAWVGRFGAAVTLVEAS